MNKTHTLEQRLIGPDRLAQLNRQRLKNLDLDSQRTFPTHLKRDTLTAFEAKQQLRHEMLVGRLTNQHNGEGGRIMAKYTDAVGRSREGALFDEHGELIHPKQDDGMPDWPLIRHSRYRFLGRVLAELLGDTMAWANAQVNTNAFIHPDEHGTERLFITEQRPGLECAIAQMNWFIRYDIRSHMAQIQDVDGEWMAIDDQVECFVRDTIAFYFSFFNPSPKDPNKLRSRCADWSQSRWKVVWNSFLSGQRIDSFSEWLHTLPFWDQVPRLDHWLTQCGLVPKHPREQEELIQWAARSILLIACIRTTQASTLKAKHDTIPVLIGPQGLGKSTLLQLLFPEGELQRNQWFTDTLKLNADEKKRVESIQGAVIAEAAEMSGATTADIESLRAFLSRTNDKIRLSYRHNPEPLPRLCSIVGTANGTTVLPNDPAGNRRFVAIEFIHGNPEKSFAYLNQWREQLWAEALERTQQGELATLPNHLRKAQAIANEDVRADDALMEEAVSDYLIERYTAGVRLFTAAEVADGARLLRDGESAAAVAQPIARRLVRVLERLGCTKQRLRQEGIRKRGWKMPEHGFDHEGPPGL